MWETTKIAMDVIQFVLIVAMAWNTIRAMFFQCTYDEKKVDVPRDEVKEAYRRAAVAKVSADNGGRRLNLSWKWYGWILKIFTVEESKK